MRRQRFLLSTNPCTIRIGTTMLFSCAFSLVACQREGQEHSDKSSSDDLSKDVDETLTSVETSDSTDTISTVVPDDSSADISISDSTNSSADSCSDSGDSGGCPDGQEIDFDDGASIHKHVFNLVDEDAQAEVEGFLKGEVDSLAGVTQSFFHYFRADYDFVLFVLDHPLDTGAVGKTQFVNRSPMIGTGVRYETRSTKYPFAGRLKSVIALQGTNGRGPLEHELVHFWAMHLDPSLGFGKSGDVDIGGHWGIVSVNGQLGGFDASTLACADAGTSAIPDCIADDAGRFQYTVAPFAANTNTFRGVPYAPLELYMMGLVGKDDVDPSYIALPDAKITRGQTQDDPYTIDSAMPTEITMAQIIELHGERSLEPEDNRHFRAAFVLVTATPASAELLEEVARKTGSISESSGIGMGTWNTFEEATGHRATLSVELGARRKTSDPKVDPRAPACTLVPQACGEDLGCYYGSNMTLCGIAGSKQVAETCESSFDCAAGLGCWGTCTPYCDLNGKGSDSCDTLCPANFERLSDLDKVEIAGLCRPTNRQAELGPIPDFPLMVIASQSTDTCNHIEQPLSIASDSSQ